MILLDTEVGSEHTKAQCVCGGPAQQLSLTSLLFPSAGASSSAVRSCCQIHPRVSTTSHCISLTLTDVRRIAASCAYRDINVIVIATLPAVSFTCNRLPESQKLTAVLPFDVRGCIRSGSQISSISYQTTTPW